jgi:type IV pilus assembly protein PilW
MMKSRKNPAVSAESGFGLVEILVGLAIGLITTLVIVQVVTSFEAQKRTTTSSADAQTNGSIALYTLQRAAQMAGFGMPIFGAANQPLSCSLPQTYDDDGDAGALTAPIGIVPVTLIDGVSDTIIIRNDRNDGTVPTTPDTGGVPLTVVSVAGAVVTVTNNLGCGVTDTAFIVNGASCAMSKIITVTGLTSVTLATAPGITGGSLSCIKGWHETTYKVSTDGNNNLMTDGKPTLAGIVNIQAQYGITATPLSTQVTAWVNPTAGSIWETTATSPSLNDRKRIKAIKIAIVARSGLLEKTDVTTTCSSLVLPTPTGLCAWPGTTASPAPAIDLSADPNWTKYRYRVFETIIPIRNMIWSWENLP